MVFAIGFVGGVFTAYHIWQVRPVAQAAPPTAVPLASRLPGLDGQAFRYLKVLGLLSLFNLVNSMAAPLAVHALALVWLILRWG